VLSTWTLLHNSEHGRGNERIRRCLEAGGSFHLVEHGQRADEKIARMQRRLEPLNKTPAGGCHLTRHMSRTSSAPGFDIEQIDTYYFR